MSVARPRQPSNLARYARAYSDADGRIDGEKNDDVLTIDGFETQFLDAMGCKLCEGDTKERMRSSCGVLRFY